MNLDKSIFESCLLLTQRTKHVSALRRTVISVWLNRDTCSIGRLWYSDIPYGGGNRQQKCVLPRVVAAKCTELSGVTIDVSCGKISLRGYGVAAIMTEVGQQYAPS